MWYLQYLTRSKVRNSEGAAATELVSPRVKPKDASSSSTPSSKGL